LGAALSFVICQIITRVFLLVSLRCNTPRYTVNRVILFRP
jgi:hypothetical protein